MLVSLFFYFYRLGREECGILALETTKVMQFYWLTLGILAVWRISYLLSSEAGPWNLAARIRQRLQTAFRTELVSCLYCLSIWIAVPFAFILGESWKHRFLLWPALSAGAIIVERTVHRETPAPLYYEDRNGDRDYEDLENENQERQEPQEDQHVLRQEP
jgi:hypothetical protein